MKHAKKLLSLLLALTLVFALATTALADGESYTITIDNAVEGETYTAYKIFSVTYSNLADPAPGEILAAPNADNRSFYTSYSYTIDSGSPWWSIVTENGSTNSETGVITANGLTFTPSATDSTYTVAATDSFDAAAFAALLNSNKTATGISPAGNGKGTVSGEGENKTVTATIDVTTYGAGYYFVDTSLGSLCSLDTTEPTATIREKNTTTTQDKTVQEDSTSAWGDKNDASIGDTVNFTSTVTIGAHQKNVVFHDIMQTDKLDIDWDSIKVSAIAEDYVTIYTSEENAANPIPTDNPDYTGDTFAVAFDSSWTESLESDTKVTITYSATLTEKAIIGEQKDDEDNALAMDSGNDNKSSVTYGDAQRTTWDWTRTYTWAFDIFKYTGTDTPLAGAEFQLEDTNGTPLTFTLVEEGKAAVAADPDNEIVAQDATPTVYRYDADGAVTTLVTPDSGLIQIQGLDADTYTLVETEAPEGYNKLSGKVTVVLDSNTDTAQGTDGTQQKEITLTLTQDGNTVTQIGIENKTGNELPSTGGIGTTIFYVLGGILVVGAAVLLVTKKRMSAEK